jgi:hypothetical protein
MQRSFRRRMLSAAPALVLAGCGPFSTSPLALQGGRTDATFTSEALAPAGAFAHDAEAPAPPIAHGGLVFHASVTPSGSLPEAGEKNLMVQVRVQNPSAEEVALAVRGCTVWPEFHREPARSGAPVWVPEGECMQQPYELSIPAGGETVLGFLAYDVMLANALPDGRYFVVARVHLAEETLRLNAGSGDVRLDLAGMAYHVRVDRASGGGLAATVGVENRNPTPVHVEYGACAVGLELHADAAMAGRGHPLHHGYPCPDYLVVGPLRPGEVLAPREFEHRVTGGAARDVPAGEYHLAVTLRLNWRTYRFPAGTVRVR